MKRVKRENLKALAVVSVAATLYTYSSLRKLLKRVKPEECDRLLEALAVASVVASLYTCSSLVGVFSAPVAIYCLIVKHRGKADS
jgi:hypothetical protein